MDSSTEPIKKKVVEEEDFDSILATVGSKGRYQKKLLYYVLVPICFSLGYVICQILFQAAIPKYWCHVPGRENTTFTEEEWIDLTIPRENGTDKYASCRRYAVEFVQGNVTVDTNRMQECTDGWDFNHRQFTSTVATTLGWYCEKESYSHNLLTINMAGNAVGTFVFPIVADVLGRRIVFFVLLAIHVVFTLSYVWVPNYIVHLVFRFCRGVVELTLYFIPHVTVLELIDPEDRAKATSIAWTGWLGGMCITSLIAYYMPNWQYLALSSCIPGILGFAYWRHFPESPRWLLTKGRVTECTDILLQVAEMNKTHVSRNELETRLAGLAKQQEEKVSFLEAFKYPRLRLRTIAILVMSPCIYLVYGVTLFGISVLPDNQFLSHFILSVSELPSNGLGLALVHFLGRRVTCYTTFFITGVFCAVSIFCTHDQWLMMIMLCLIKLFSTTALLVMYVITAEIYPTPIRSAGLGLMAVTGLVAMAVAPIIMNTGFGPTFQYWVMLFMMMLSLVTSLAMPETLGLPLPQTFQEAEDMGSDRPLTTFVNHWNQHNYSGRKYSKVDLVTTKEELEKLNKNSS